MTYVILLTVYYRAAVGVTTIGPYRDRKFCEATANYLVVAYGGNPYGVTTAKALCVEVQP